MANMGIGSIKSTEEFKALTQNIGDAIDVVILDLRPFNQYNVSRVKDSLSICVPTTLLKRSSFHLSNIFKTMVASQEQILQSKLESQRDLRVIFYDSSSNLKHCSLHLHQIIKKFQDSINDYDKNIDLYIVDEGFSMFEKSEMGSTGHHLIDNTKFKEPGMQDTTESGGAFASFVLPSADPASTFIMSLKNNSAFPDTKGTVLRAPTFKDPNELPIWLQRYSKPDAVNSIISNFMNIENLENARIGASVKRKSISTGSNRSPASSIQSPGDHITLNGSEYGFKNRYPNILPYEHSRVKLMPSPMSGANTPFGNPGSLTVKPTSSSVSPNASVSTSSNNSATSKRTDDYFNANFLSVPQVNSDAKYIATQAPLPATINDFWKVVWSNNVELVISLTNLAENGMKKSDVYWQESSMVHLVSEEDNFQGVENLTVRTIELTKRGQTRTVHQLHLKCWPDFGTVKYSELHNLIRVRDFFSKDKKTPIVVHCSAGCGRTGVFITIDILIEAFKKLQMKRLSEDDDKMTDSNIIDIWRTDEDLIYLTVQQLRKQRISMVQSLDQFVFCYESILEYFASMQKENTDQTH
ncbi:Tyrosine-protein phosphatase 2 [Cyberlindnera fabianii]|nr:Tyrosine-protein phosphatase 2 [Cyberlindnera fabianii]